MKESYVESLILENTEIEKNIYKIVLSGKFEGAPGQFYMLRGWNNIDPYLGRPLSICDLGEDSITFLYEVVGRGTRIMGELKPGDSLSLLGPLGNTGISTKLEGNIAMFSGGAGIAPMYYLGKELKKNNKSQVDLFAGFRDDEYFTDEFKSFTRDIYIGSETGKAGYKGYVLDLLDTEEYDHIVVCGPDPMIKAVYNKCKNKEKLIISMGGHMACGVGTCSGCTIPTSKGNKRVCKDGPVFNGSELIFK